MWSNDLCNIFARANSQMLVFLMNLFNFFEAEQRKCIFQLTKWYKLWSFQFACARKHILLFWMKLFNFFKKTHFKLIFDSILRVQSVNLYSIWCTDATTKLLTFLMVKTINKCILMHLYNNLRTNHIWNTKKRKIRNNMTN